MQHLLTIEELTQQDLKAILSNAQKIVDNKQHYSNQLNTLKDKTVANLFFENSTRTRCSFELAAKRLGAEVLNLDLKTSATAKGETVLDTIHTLEAMHVNAFIIRHGENDLQKFVAENLKTNASVLNAGDGTHAHPTQALLDMLTIAQYKNFSDLSIAIVGDIAHSRVAKSNLVALEKLGVKDIRLIGPEAFLPKDTPCQTYHDFDIGIKEVDVVMMLRIQKERMDEAAIPDTKEYFQAFGLDQRRLKLAKADAIVMHPGPMNRGIEIEAAVADGEQSVILKQVENGIAARMAILKMLL